MEKWSFRATCGNLAALAIGAIFLLGAAATGALWITTLPSGADVWLDGTYVGRSPLVLDALASGEHKLTLTRTGWAPQDVSATVAPAQTVTTAVVLARGTIKLPGASGTLAFYGAHPPVVAIDGEPILVPKDGTIVVAAGTHELVFIGSGGKTIRSVTVYPQTRTDVVLTSDAEPRSAVIAPATDYLPAGAYHFDGTSIVVHFGGHDVIARIGTNEYRVDGRSAAYDSVPTMINGRLYLPIELLSLLNPNTNVPKK